MRRLCPLLIAAAALAAGASSAAAYSAPDMRLRELDVADRPVGPWLPLDGAQLQSANGYQLGIVLEQSGEHVLVEVTEVPPGASIEDQRNVYSRLCFEQTGTPGEVVDLDQRILYAGNGTYGVRMTVSDAQDASTGCTTANATSGMGTFSVNAHLTVRRIGARRLVLNPVKEPGRFGGWAIDPPHLGSFPELLCALDAVRQPDGSLTGPVVQSIGASRNRRAPGEPYVASHDELPRPGVWSCVAGQPLGSGLVRPPWSEPTPPEVVQEPWYGLDDQVIADRRPPSIVMSATADDYRAGGTVRLRVFRSRCNRKPRRVAVARGRVRPNGKVAFRFRLPRLPRRADAAIYTLDSSLGGNRLIIPRRYDEPNVTVVRVRGRQLAGFTLTGCS